MPDGSVSTTFLVRPDQMLTLLQIGRHVNSSKFSTDYDINRILLAAGVLYLVLAKTGFVASLQTTVNNAGFPRFRLRARAVFEILAVLTLAGAIAWTAVMVLAAVLFNLVADAAGGIDITLKE